MPEVTCPHCGNHFSAALGATECPECGRALRPAKIRPGGDDRPRTLKQSTPAASAPRERLAQLRDELTDLQAKAQELESKTTLTAKTKKAALVGKIAAIKKQIQDLEGRDD